MLERQFNLESPNTAWVTDITYIRAHEGWLYLPVVLDLYSRRIIGRSMELRMVKELVLDALMMAVWRRKPKHRVTIRSDRHSIYEFKISPLLWRYRIKQSMSRQGNCWDNAPMERFFRSFKTEWMPELGYRTFLEAKRSITNYIVGYFCPIRPHQHNNMMSPNRAEELH